MCVLLGFGHVSESVCVWVLRVCVWVVCGFAVFFSLYALPSNQFFPFLSVCFSHFSYTIENSPLIPCWSWWCCCSCGCCWWWWCWFFHFAITLQWYTSYKTFSLNHFALAAKYVSNQNLKILCPHSALIHHLRLCCWCWHWCCCCCWWSGNGGSTTDHNS